MRGRGNIGLEVLISESPTRKECLVWFVKQDGIIHFLSFKVKI